MNNIKYNNFNHVFLDKNPVFCSIILIGASITDRASKIMKAIPHFFSQKDMKDLYLINTKEILSKIKDFYNTNENNLKKLFDNKPSEIQLIQNYSKINKREVSPEDLFSSFRKSLNYQSNSLSELILKDLPTELLPKALNMVVRYNKLELCQTMLSDERYSYVLGIEHIDTLNRLLHISVKNESQDVMKYLIENTQAKLLLQNAKYVQNMLNTCNNEGLANSLKVLNNYSLNLEQSGEFFDSKYISDNAPNIRKGLLNVSGNSSRNIMEEDGSRWTRV